jgi:hypothetical protein
MNLAFPDGVGSAALAWHGSLRGRVSLGTAPDISPPCLPAGRDMPAAEPPGAGQAALANGRPPD